jgi:hypothetical protein
MHMPFWMLSSGSTEGVNCKSCDVAKARPSSGAVVLGARRTLAATLCDLIESLQPYPELRVTTHIRSTEPRSRSERLENFVLRNTLT